CCRVPDSGSDLRLWTCVASAPVLRRLRRFHHHRGCRRPAAMEDELYQHRKGRDARRRSRGNADTDRNCSGRHPVAHFARPSGGAFLRPGAEETRGRMILCTAMDHRIVQYRLEQGALEVEYMEEMFTEFSGKKTAAEIMSRLQNREHLILISLGISSEDPTIELPVAFKVGHELKQHETNLQLADLVTRLGESVKFAGRKVFYSWIGGTRREWRGQGHYRALTEQQ